MLNAVATLGRPLRLAKYGKYLWRSRRLRRAFVQAQVALGDRMYSVGIDDGVLGTKLIVLDEQVRLAEAVGDSTQALKAARRQLVLQLAAAALEDDGPLPGADAEYLKAREAQAALDKQRERYERCTHGPT